MNLIGYFKNIKNEQIQITLSNPNGIGEDREIKLAGDEPFVTELNADDDTIFSPIKKNNATLQVVDKTYLENILPNRPKDCTITARNLKTNELIYDGYVSCKVYESDYENEWERFEINAIDKITILQYEKYKTKNPDYADIVSLNDILSQICSYAGFEGYFFPNRFSYSATTTNPTTTTLTPHNLYISEKNWAYEDVEENLDLLEILTEITKYFGLTAIQVGNILYMIDYGQLSTRNSISGNIYRASTNYAQGQAIELGTPKELNIKGEDIKINSNNISFVPIYNKIRVKSNQYQIEDFLPDIFDEELLTNRIDKDNFTEFVGMIPAPEKGKYQRGNKLKEEETDDNDFQYWLRLFDNKYWDSLYFLGTPSEEELKSEDCLKKYGGGTLVEMGVSRLAYFDKEKWQEKISHDTEWKKYLCINQKYEDDRYTYETPIFRLKPNFKPACFVDNENSFIAIDFNALFERYKDRPYINPEWTNEENKAGTRYDGVYVYRVPKIPFRLKIGNKYWNGENWQEEATNFEIALVAPEDLKPIWNTSFEVNNTISYITRSGEKGYKVHLNGVDITEPISMEILIPRPAQVGQLPNKFWEYNAYLYLEDLSIKLVSANSADGKDDEADFLYENIIDEDNVTEFNEITLKISTFVKGTRPSYSHMLFKNESGFDFLRNINGNKAEENLINKFYNQYSTQTQNITLGLSTEITPFTKLTNVQVKNLSKPFVMKSNRIDHKYLTQEIIMEEIK